LGDNLPISLDRTLITIIYPDAMCSTMCFSLWKKLILASVLIRYSISPLLYDPLGFSDGYDYISAGSGPVYLDRPDVKAAINAPPDQTWVFCSNTPVFVNGTDN
jgi:hypothetical protein